MRKTIVLGLIAAAICMAVIITLSCRDRFTGSLEVTVQDAVPRQIVPPVSMAVTAWDILVDGPATYAYDNQTSGVLITDMPAGSYDVTVTGLNNSTIAIGEGQELDVSVTIGGSAVSNIVIEEYDGQGTFDAEVNWSPAGNVPDPVVESSLTPGLGGSIPLTFNIVGAQATYNGLQDRNFYAWEFRLFNETVGTALLGGFADIVRIVKDYTTTALVDIIAYESPGELQINVSVDIGGELVIDSTRIADVIYVFNGDLGNPAVNIDAEIDGVTNHIFQWYLTGNQELVETAAVSYYAMDPADMTESASPGTEYRLDVLAFTVDGKSAGSHAWEVRRIDGNR